MASLLTRLRHTPLRDLLRGHVTGRLNWRELIALSADVSPAAKSLIQDVVRRTHLWRTERVELANELLGHFADGNAAGESDELLLAEFGEARNVAILIRRAKVRARPWIWQIFFRACQVFAVFCVCYGATVFYYYSGRPAPRADLIGALNSRVARTPTVLQAWPIYRTALGTLQAKDGRGQANFSGDSVEWAAAAEWIDQHDATVASIRVASKLPVLGCTIESGIGSMAHPTQSSPQLNELRLLSDLLAFDARRAREVNDASRVEADVTALADMAQQERRGNPFEAAQLASLSILGRSHRELGYTLEQAPHLLDDAALLRLAHHISMPQTGSDLISFRGEQLLFEDVLQQTFTDDGHGDGRFSPQGWTLYKTTFLEKPQLPEPLRVEHSPEAALQPASVLVTASRKELLNEYQRVMDLNDAMIRVPLRDANSQAAYAEWRTLNSSNVSRLRYGTLLTLFPTMHRTAEMAERSLGERDGLLVAIALELFHRKNQRYPKALEELTPSLLAAVPADRITGGPLKYRLINGRPVVYSVGVDRIDDGGEIPNRNGEAQPGSAAQWGNLATLISGDWILYPVSRAGDADVKK